MSALGGNIDEPSPSEVLICTLRYLAVPKNWTGDVPPQQYTLITVEQERELGAIGSDVWVGG